MNILELKANKMKKDEINNPRTFDELLDIKYGKIGSPSRNEYESMANYFVISEMLKEARKEAHITQQQLAEKIGTKKSYISRLENGKADIQLSTLYKIFETGLGRKIRLTIL
jgi:HTH-type transcriptional regulator / antitoxin HipB